MDSDIWLVPEVKEGLVGDTRNESVVESITLTDGIFEENIVIEDSREDLVLNSAVDLVGDSVICVLSGEVPTKREDENGTEDRPEDLTEGVGAVSEKGTVGDRFFELVDETGEINVKVTGADGPEGETDIAVVVGGRGVDETPGMVPTPVDEPGLDRESELKPGRDTSGADNPGDCVATTEL